MTFAGFFKIRSPCKKLAEKVEEAVEDEHAEMREEAPIAKRDSNLAHGKRIAKRKLRLNTSCTRTAKAVE
jgi:hypothetical protein